MPAFVLVKIRRVTKLSRAFLAFERAIPGVNSNVYFKTARAKERFSAMVAFVLLLARVFQKVRLERGVLGEGRITLITSVGFAVALRSLGSFGRIAYKKNTKRY